MDLAVGFLFQMIYDPTIKPGLDTCDIINTEEVLLIHSEDLVGVDVSLKFGGNHAEKWQKVICDCSGSWILSSDDV